MASTKYLVIFFVALNLVSLFVFTSVGNFNTPVEGLKKIYDLDQDTISGEITATGKLSAGLEKEYNSSLSTESTVSTDVFKFLDGIKLVINVLSFLTPFPFIAVMWNLDVQLYVLLGVSFPIIILWILGTIEFIRGGSW